MSLKMIKEELKVLGCTDLCEVIGSIDTYGDMGLLAHGKIGTDDEENIISDLLYELEKYANKNNNLASYKDVIKKGNDILEKGEYETDETEKFINGALSDALSDFTPPYCYFSNRGGEFGYVPNADDFDGLRVDDLNEVPKKYTGEVLHVNDHGNTTLYSVNKGKLKEIWSVV